MTYENLAGRVEVVEIKGLSENGSYRLQGVTKSGEDVLIKYNRSSSDLRFSSILGVFNSKPILEDGVLTCTLGSFDVPHGFQGIRIQDAVFLGLMRLDMDKIIPSIQDIKEHFGFQYIPNALYVIQTRYGFIPILLGDENYVLNPHGKEEGKQMLRAIKVGGVRAVNEEDLSPIEQVIFDHVLWRPGLPKILVALNTSGTLNKLPSLMPETGQTIISLPDF